MPRLKIEVFEDGAPSATITIPSWLVLARRKYLPKIAGKPLQHRVDLEQIIALASEPGANGVILDIEDHEDNDRIIISIVGDARRAGGARLAAGYRAKWPDLAERRPVGSNRRSCGRPPTPPPVPLCWRAAPGPAADVRLVRLPAPGVRPGRIGVDHQLVGVVFQHHHHLAPRRLPVLAQPRVEQILAIELPALGRPVGVDRRIRTWRRNAGTSSRVACSAPRRSATCSTSCSRRSCDPARCPPAVSCAACLEESLGNRGSLLMSA